MDNIKNLRDYIFPNGQYSNVRANSRLIRKRFPEIYNNIKEDYKTNLYMLLYDIKTIPECKNPNCHNKVSLKSIGSGFRKYCSNKCIGDHQKTDETFSSKIKETHKERGRTHLNEKYPNLDLSYINHNNLLIKKYCPHGDIRISLTVFNKLYDKGQNLCYECNKELIDSYIPSSKEILDFKNKFNKFYKDNSLKLSAKWFITYFPKEYKIILDWSSHLSHATLSERVYMFKNSIKDRPICPICHKNSLKYSASQMSYNKICSSYSCKRNTSMAKINVYNFIESLDPNANQKLYLGKREFDIVSPDNKLIIEYNGLYWHSEKNLKNKYYHLDKKKLALDNGYNLFYIWEDDWNNKTEIIKSMIKSRMGLSPNRIYARKTSIIELSSRQNKLFFDSNHLQGNTSASIKLGLIYDGEIVAAMTFGKNRKVFGDVKSKSKDNEYELIRFANNIDTNVIGGASKLFKYFIRKYDPSKIISYANYDISNGELYENLGFKDMGHTGVNFWWFKNKKRFPRYDFMKYKLVNQGEDPNKTADEIMNDKGYLKIWGSGNLKYEWIK